MNKKNKGILLALVLCMTFGLYFETVSAASGNIVVHYLDSIRKPTYDYTTTHGQGMGYSVYGYNNSTNANILNQLDSSAIMVMHLHGSPGVQAMANSTYLSGTGGNGGTIRSVSSLSSGSLNNLKLAIYYGMDVGYTGSSYGDICQQTVNKGAQAAVAWRGVMVTSEANEWNRLFFEKAKTENIVEGFRHADYWLRYTMSEDAATRMGSSNRNEKGNIYGIIHQ